MIQFHTSEIEKQIGYRVQTILSDPDLLSVFKEFGAEIFRRSSVFHGLRQFLTEEGVVGGVAFEVGTWNALTSVVLSRFFDQVVTVDIAHNEEKHRVLAHLGIRNVQCIDIVDNEHKARIARDTKFDFAYLDGNHADDTNLDWDLTKKCGRVLFQECWPFQQPVFNLVHSLPSHQVSYGGMGLALWDGSKK